MHADHTGGAAGSFAPHAMTQSQEAEIRRPNGNGLSHHLPAQITALLAENQELRAELEGIKAERAKLADIVNRLMDALGTKSPERIVHDVRNVLNERELYRALADATM